MLSIRLSLVAAIVALACCTSNFGSLEKRRYDEINELPTPEVFAIFIDESKKPMYKGRFISNTTIILGRRGREALNLVLESPYRGDKFLYHEFFINLAFYSKINPCDDARFHKFEKSFPRNKSEFRFNCQTYLDFSQKNSDVKLNINDPFFVN